MISWENVRDDEELKELGVLKKFVMGDYVKIAILEQLVRGEWCTLNELCRAARGYDKYVGHVRVSTILQYMEDIAKGVLEKAENGFSVKWRIRPEKRRVIESWIAEIKSAPHRKGF